MIDTVLAQGKLRQLMATLLAERKILLNGPLEDLEKTTARREKLFEALQNGGPVSQRILGERLPDIRSMAKRNAALLKAAMDGMKNARKDIENMQENLTQMDTYSREGARIVVAEISRGSGHKV